MNTERNQRGIKVIGGYIRNGQFILTGAASDAADNVHQSPQHAEAIAAEERKAFAARGVEQRKQLLGIEE
jgi:hypothetical protein